MLEKENQEILDLNMTEWRGAQKEVYTALDVKTKALDHYLDRFHLCPGKFMVHCEDAKINHTALLAECGYKFRIQNFFCHSRSLPLYTAAAQLEGHPKDFRTPE